MKYFNKMKKKDYHYWEPILIRELLLLWKKSDKFLPCHGPDHHLCVWRMAKPFGPKKKADMEVLAAACLLHDVYCFNIGAPQGHDTKSAKIAKKVLIKIKFPKDKISAVIAAIAGHRSKTQTNNLEGKIVKSFDKIDAFGPVGVYRVIAPFSIRKYGADDIVGWVLKEKRLDKKWAAIPFPELKKKYKHAYFYSKKYFKSLANNLNRHGSKKSRISEAKIYST